MKIIIKILFLCIFAYTPLLADEAYPYSYFLKNIHNNGKALNTRDGVSYIMKKNFENAETVLYIKKSQSSNSTQILQLGNIDVIEAVIIESNLLCIYREKESVYIELFDAKGGRITKELINQISTFQSGISKIKIIDHYHQSILVHYDRKLISIDYSQNKFKISEVIDDVIDAKYSMNGVDIICVTFNQSGSTLSKINENLENIIITKLPAYENAKLLGRGDTVVVASGNDLSKSTLLQSISSNHGILLETWIECNYQNILVENINTDFYITYLKSSGNYSIVKQKLALSIPMFSILINERLIEPFAIKKHSNRYYVFFRNGLMVIDTEGKVIGTDFIPIGEYLKDSISIDFVGDNISLSSNNSELIIGGKGNSFWFIYKYYQNIGKLIIPSILLLISIILYHLYRKQKTMLLLLQEHAVQGVIYHVDKAGRLLRANKNGKELLGITESVPKRKSFIYYCVNPSLDQLREYIDRALNSKNTISQKIILNTGLDSKEWVFNAVPIRNIAGRYMGIIITGIDISEELEKKRLSNWASLAHDMQTNLSTIRLNAEQLQISVESDNYLRKTKIIHQVNVLIQRVRDIVTVGRANNLDKQFYDSSDICKEVIAEFDSAMFPNVAFQVETSSIKVLCDKAKMLRAIRNAIENGIRSLKGNSGTIKISNSSDYKNVYFKIKDSGIGMDERTKAKMLKPYFTTGSSEGGFGIGTMIMQHVAELHGGEIIIHSETNKGTEIIFSIPNYSATMNKKTSSNKLFLRKKVT